MRSNGFLSRNWLLLNKTFKSWCKSVQLHIPMRENFDLIWGRLSQAATPRKRPPRLDILGGCLRKIRLYLIIMFIIKGRVYDTRLFCVISLWRGCKQHSEKSWLSRRLSKWHGLFLCDSYSTRHKVEYYISRFWRGMRVSHASEAQGDWIRWSLEVCSPGKIESEICPILLRAHKYGLRIKLARSRWLTLARSFILLRV